MKLKLKLEDKNKEFINLECDIEQKQAIERIIYGIYNSISYIKEKDNEKNEKKR